MTCWCITDAGVAESIRRLLHLNGGRSGIPAGAKPDGCGRVSVSGRSPRRDTDHVRLWVHRRKEILPGTSCLSHTIVSSGVYRLELSMPGYTAGPTRVEIRSDEISEVRLLLSESR